MAGLAREEGVMSRMKTTLLTLAFLVNNLGAQFAVDRLWSNRKKLCSASPSS